MNLRMTILTTCLNQAAWSRPDHWGAWCRASLWRTILKLEKYRLNHIVNQFREDAAQTSLEKQLGAKTDATCLDRQMAWYGCFNQFLKTDLDRTRRCHAKSSNRAWSSSGQEIFWSAVQVIETSNRFLPVCPPRISCNFVAICVYNLAVCDPAWNIRSSAAWIWGAWIINQALPKAARMWKVP